jgi:hypothetical protein
MPGLFTSADHLGQCVQSGSVSSGYLIPLAASHGHHVHPDDPHRIRTQGIRSLYRVTGSLAPACLA